MTVAPVLVAEQLPESNPVKKAAVDFVKRFEKAARRRTRARCSRRPPGTRC